MSANSLPVNRAARILGGLIQELMLKGEAAALAYLIIQLPIFSNPLLNKLASWALNVISAPIQTFLINNATSIVINIQTSSEQANVLAAATALKIAQDSGNQAAIDEGLKNAKEAYQKLFSWDGAFSAP